VAPHSGKSIYQWQAEKVVSLSRRLGREVPFLVMTSPMTDVETRDFFAAHAYFGLKPAQVRFFPQGLAPSLDQSGRALLSAPGALLENPDGHGGCFTALVKSGELEKLRAAGIEAIVYIQVDNVLAPVDDPILVGALLAERAEVVTKVLERVTPDEKVGLLLHAKGRDRIIEYTELEAYKQQMQAPDGGTIFRWGSPAMHAWSVAFLARLAKQGYQPPLHRSAKPLKAYDNGSTSEVKGWKNERFIFDLIPEASVSIGLAINRAAEFAPIKNASGVDSVVSAVQLAHEHYADWLRAAGVALTLPDSARIEISPLFAATKEQFIARWDRRIAEISGDYYLEA
jgi:UDP-N-acetylglucosamine/UDP-N-acetylgalactosamine diphosphorylase